jgi:hypothetical protein
VGVDTLFALSTWQIQKEKNKAHVSRGAKTQPSALVQQTEADTKLWITTGEAKLGCLLRE